MNLQSSVNRKGKVVIQVTHFKGNIKRTFHGVITDTIEQGEFTKFELEDGRMIQINTKNVLYFEVFNTR